MDTAALTLAGVTPPVTLAAHKLHDPDRIWPLTSCYADLWIELLHVLGLDPYPALAFTADIEWEGDHFTFLKPDLPDLEALYGLRVQELALWDRIEDHVAAQLAQRRLVLLEVDAFHLPDLAGGSYRREHTKTTIAFTAIDRAGQRCAYVHNAAQAMLEGADYEAVLRHSRPAGLPLLGYAELVKGSRQPLPETSLRAATLALLSVHLERRPATGQTGAFRAAFPTQLDTMLARPALFHPWAFNTVRQLGAGAELLASLLGWLDERGVGRSFAGPQASAIGLASSAKALQFRIARLIARGRTDRCDDLFDVLEADEAAIVKGLEACLA